MGTHDDLERLLADVDEKTDYEISRDQSLRDSERRARRADSAVEGGEGDAAGAVTVEEFVARYGEDIEFFRSGMTAVLGEHQRIDAEFKKLFSDSQIPRDVDDIIKKYRYTYLKYLENIEDLVNEHTRYLSPDALLRESKKNFHKKFQGYEDENRLAFLSLKEIFLRLREFNSRVKKEWDELARSIEVINLSSSGRAYYAELSSRCAAAAEFCRRTETFLHFVATVLSLGPDDYYAIEKDIYGKIRYFENFSYQYENLFRRSADAEREVMRSHDDALQLDDGRYAVGAAEDDEPAPVETEPPRHAQIERTVEPEPAPSPGPPAPPRSSFAPAVAFTVTGTRTWNTREPYVLALRVDALERDYVDLGSSFFYIDSPADEAALKAAIKIAMIKFLRDRSQNIVESYRGFVHHVIRDAIGEAGSFFDLSADRLQLFTYHLGPLTTSRIVTAVFQARGIGSCYKYVEGSVVKRFLPAEFIREASLMWHEQYINTLELPFDRIQEFDELRKLVSRTYHAEIQRVLGIIRKVDVESKLAKKTDAEKLEIFRDRWMQWFGAVPMAVYRRFVEKSLLR
ncbi:MAG TPA: hypothetical protein PKM65_08980 [Spirochaetota bacterium]|nr:hypothetical protein [Spirochaetota bacterium]HNT12436.1 hypothetical protein [Spirochaetota bacterium]HNV47309.1 hypothetical protein [Spirochaetota bacterium]HPU87439.1 hypothetical protein [Spirochaetota bacterium]